MLVDDPDSSDIFRPKSRTGPGVSGYYRPYAGGETGAWLTVESGGARRRELHRRRNSTGDRPGCPAAQSPAYLPIHPAAEKSAPRPKNLARGIPCSPLIRVSPPRPLCLPIPALGISDVGL